MIPVTARRIAIASAVAITLMGCGTFQERAWVAQGPADYKLGSRGDAQAVQQAQQTAQTQASRPGPPAVAQAPAASAPRVDDLSTAGGYTQAMRYGDLLFVSGQIAMDLQTMAFNEAATIEQQTQLVMTNIRRILEGQRLTMANIVSVTVYLKNMNDYAAMNATYETFFRSHLPARSVVEVARIPRNALVEISVIAGR